MHRQARELAYRGELPERVSRRRRSGWASSVAHDATRRLALELETITPTGYRPRVRLTTTGYLVRRCSGSAGHGLPASSTELMGRLAGLGDADGLIVAPVLDLGERADVDDHRVLLSPRRRRRATAS